MWAKLVPASGNAIKAAVVDPATGTYTIPLVPAGTYSVIIDDNGALTDITPTAPATWSNANTRTGPLPRGGVSRRWRSQRDGPRLLLHSRSADLERKKAVADRRPPMLEGRSPTPSRSPTTDRSRPQTSWSPTCCPPACLTYVSQSGTGTYVPATGIWTVPSVASGQTVTLTILELPSPLTVNSVVTNSAEVTDSLSFDTHSTPGNSRPPRTTTRRRRSPWWHCSLRRGRGDEDRRRHQRWRR